VSDDGLLRPAQWGWLAALGGAALFGAAAALLGSSIGSELTAVPPDLFADPSIDYLVRPEPTELGRALVALAAPFAIALLVVAMAGRRWPPVMRRLATVAAVVMQALVAVIGLVGVLHRDLDFLDADLASFTTLALLAAGVLAVGALVLACHQPARRWIASLDRATSKSRWGSVVTVAAVSLTVIWLLPAVFREQNVVDGGQYVWGHLQVTFEDFSAVLNGATPAVDYASQYSALLPFLVDPMLSLTGSSPTEFTLWATLLSLLALIAVYATFRIVTGSRIAAAGLYLPFLAASLLPLTDGGVERTFNADVYQILPLRYLAPFAIAWLLARWLSGLRGAPPIAIFAVAGLAVFNNPEFGVPALGALVVAVVLHEASKTASQRRLRALAWQAVAGLAVAVSVVFAITLIRSGELPSTDVWLLFSRLIGRAAFVLVPLPEVGLYFVLYITFAAALVVAGVRSAAREPDRVLTALLAYAGAFGLGAGLYYVGRSQPENLLAIYPAWGFALGLGVWLVVGRLAAAADLRTAVARVGVLGVGALFAFALLVTTIPTMPTPWRQLERIASSSDAPSPTDVSANASFVREWSTPGESVALITTLGHYTAEEAGVDDVSPFNSPQHLISLTNLQLVLDALADAGGRNLFTTSPGAPRVPETGFTPGSRQPLYQGTAEALRARGWSEVAADESSEITLWRQR
jgi:hypothetical protein